MPIRLNSDNRYLLSNSHILYPGNQTKNKNIALIKALNQD